MNTVKEVIKKIGITKRHLDYLLEGHCNATAKTARRIEQVTGIEKELWVFGSAFRRQKAWREFIADLQKESTKKKYKNINPAHAGGERENYGSDKSG